MEHTRVRVSVIRSELFAGVEPAILGTWIRALAYCADQMNGGKIKGVLEWNDRKTMAAMQSTKDEVMEAVKVGVLSKDGQDIIVQGYDKGPEETVMRHRANGAKSNGRPRKKPIDIDWMNSHCFLQKHEQGAAGKILEKFESEYLQKLILKTKRTKKLYGAEHPRLTLGELTEAIEENPPTKPDQDDRPEI